MKLIPDVDPSIPLLYCKNIELPQQAMAEAAELAERHLNAAVSVSQEASMPGIAAHALYALAVLRSLDNQVEEAKGLVRRAHELASPLGWRTLYDKLVTH